MGQLKHFYPRLPIKTIEKKLAGNDSYTRSREPKKPKFNPTYVRRKRELLQADLMDKQRLAGYNNGIRYYLVVIDCFTRYLAVRALRVKNAASVKQAFISILDELGERPRVQRLVTDGGTEFTNRVFQALLRERNIKHSLPNFHAPFVERVIRSLQSLLGKYCTEFSTLRFEQVVQLAVETYNTRKHRMIGMPPATAERADMADTVRLAMERYYAKFERKKKKKPKFQVGDVVRVRKIKAKFFRAFHETFDVPFYEVTAVLTHLPSVMYRLKNMEGVHMDDTYYEAELQKTENAPFKIQTIHYNDVRIDPRTGEEKVLVSWEGMPRTRDSYVDRWRLP